MRTRPTTEKARTWTRESDGSRLTSAQAGVLNGFPASFRSSGSGSRQFLQRGPAGGAGPAGRGGLLTEEGQHLAGTKQVA